MRRISVLCAAVGLGLTALAATSPAQAGYHLIRWDGNGLYISVSGTYLQLSLISSREAKREIAPVTVDALAQLRKLSLQSFVQDLGPTTDPVPTQFDCGWMAEDLEEHVTASVQHINVEDQPERLVPFWQPVLGYTVRAVQQLADTMDDLIARVAALEAGS